MTMRVSELTTDQLRDLLQETLRDLIEEIIEEKLCHQHDPDQGLVLRPEVETSLDEYLQSERRGKNADEVFRALGLDE